MLLTSHEREFLAVFIHEATTDPFKGPATEELHSRDIYYTDLSKLLAAYYQEHLGNQEGLGGNQVAVLPACPWMDRNAVFAREHELEGARGAKQTVC